MARALGGIILLLKGNNIEVDRVIIASSTEIVFIGFGLIIIVIMFLVSAIGIFKKKYLYWKLGIITSVLFIIDGAINGFLLFDQPLETGTIINIAVSILIIISLYLGKNSISERENN